jgi:hypothetical protein
MVSLYQIALFIHVIAAFVLIGSSLSAPLLRGAIRAAQSVPELQRWLAYSQRAGRANPPAAMVLLATGIYLGSAGWWTTGWFYVSVAAWVANMVLAVLVVKRTEAAVAAAPEMEAADRARRSLAWDMAEASMLANDFAIVWVMLNKPTLVESMAALVIAHLFVAAFELARGRAQRERVPIR